MANYKVVVESSYVNCDEEFELELDEEETRGLSEDELNMKFADDAWQTIKNNLCWHIERSSYE